MKRGAKRPATSGPAAVSDNVDMQLRSKRVMELPSFDDIRAESSHQHVIEGPQLDVQRAKSSLEQVRALNRQFASWVQSQLENHLDELWEDGVKDYLSHASHVVEEFKDVVEWLSANAAKSDSNLCTNLPSGQGYTDLTAPTNLASSNMVTPSSFSQPKSDSKSSFGLPTSLGNSSFVSNSATPILSPANNLASSKPPPNFALPQTSSMFFSSQNMLYSNTNNGLLKEVASSSSPFISSCAFSSSQGLGFFSTTGTQSSVFSGIQNSVPLKVETSSDGIEEGEIEQPSSPSLKKAEEKGVTTVHEANCKVYIKPDNPAGSGWTDMGTGHLSIKIKEGTKKATKESKPSVIVRNDVGKILLNALIYPGIKMNIRKNSIVSIFHTSGSGQNSSGEAVARTYLLRLKSVEETTKLADIINEFAPAQ
ncbi:hypothetical protein AXF42_Ash014527 [Apostasia shenzhenica]|uniref:RanBD1 domain-containing protein n=1 Tax=Apostasia shenzhenica TaxID=1088818 RepID=A0A2H9ZWR2_9ASPA|nr:hypothetical protein AXF42_Ash014527 [Apostasia shenzhenica]